MAEVVCIDGTVLGILPEAVLDRDDVPYEITLVLTRDGEVFGRVGERCGFFLATLRASLAHAHADGPLADDGPLTALLTDTDDQFPPSALESGVRAWASDSGLDPAATWSELTRYLPRERPLFTFRRRDPDDIASIGELRCTLRTSKRWQRAGSAGSPGSWRLRERALLDAWGERGQGVRAVLRAGQLLTALDMLLAEAAGVGVTYGAPADITMARPAG